MGVGVEVLGFASKGVGKSPTRLRCRRRLAPYAVHLVAAAAASTLRSITRTSYPTRHSLAALAAAAPPPCSYSDRCTHFSYTSPLPIYTLRCARLTPRTPSAVQVEMQSRRGGWADRRSRASDWIE